MGTEQEGCSAVATANENLKTMQTEEPSVTARLETLSISSMEHDDDVLALAPESIMSENGPQTPKPLGTWSASLILVNLISMGYILNPSGFAQGGTILSAICLALVSLQSILTGVYVLDACTRAEMLKSSTSYHDDDLDPVDEEEVVVSCGVAQKKDNRGPLLVRKRSLPHGYLIQVHQRTFELSELCRIFLGRWLRNLFTLTSAGDLYGITWTLAVVFGSSLSEHIPIGTGWDYQLYILIFMFITIPVSCMTFSHQLPIQVIFLLARTLMLFLMLGTLIAAFISGEAHFGSQQEAAKETPLASFSNIVTVLQLCIFSTAFQFSVPGITAETGQKGAMVKIIVRSVSYIYITNLVLSLMMATYFGSSTEASANLNWLHYHGGTWDGVGEFHRAWWATGISSYVVLFAAFDGLAVYPLLCISLGDILLGAAYEDKVHDIVQKKRLAFRLAACIPQAVGSLFLTDVGDIAKIAGIFTIVSYTICPAYLSIKSRQFMKDADLPSTTSYNTLFASDGAAWLLTFIACCLIVAVLLDATGLVAAWKEAQAPVDHAVEDDIF